MSLPQRPCLGGTQGKTGRMPAAEHSARVGWPTTWSAEQLAGWRALRTMIAKQRETAR